ncbi:MAG: DUF5753 domain-containing protein [Streptosporangiales bacterium]|nr:DUF5753 domain-containing protein [Streptosporangiales bacterium]
MNENMDPGARDRGPEGWWHSYSGVLPGWVEPYFGLELSAEFIADFEVQAIPGLLQTENYAKAQIGFGDASSEDAVTRRARARIARQDILRRAHPPRLQAVIDEGALRRLIGGPDTMREQVRHLIDMAAHPAVTLQILPFDVGGHAALGGPFIILRLPGPDAREVVYLEQLSSAEYLDDTEAVDGYLRVLDQIAAAARPPAETPRILQDVLAAI